MAAPAGSPRRVRLLLDVHHSRFAAEHLRAAGHDVTAAADDPVLASLPDEELLRAAGDDRALVTENAKDFDRIVRRWSTTGEHHAGVIFPSPLRYRRATRAYPANLVAGLLAFLAESPAAQTDLAHWLP